ncbi:MAG: hypothetical protein LBT30_02870 [Clostridiales bacterium]|jgi:hypothetical protein|nr:hypothetical protein [Clostridiales bacterium]
MKKNFKITVAVIAVTVLALFAAYNVIILTNNYKSLKLKTDPSLAVFTKTGGYLTLGNDYLSLLYDLNKGTYDLSYNGITFTSSAYFSASVKIGGNTDKIQYDSLSAISHTFTSLNIADAFGTGILLSVTNIFSELAMTQRFYLYDGAEYLITDTELTSLLEIATNDMRQILAGDGASTVLGNMKKLSFLETPYDNNEYEEFSPRIVGKGINYGYGVSMIYSESAMEALIIGALDNGVFKTALVADSKSDIFYKSSLNKLYLHYGKLSYESRDYDNVTRTADSIEHGYIRGNTLTSPRMFYGYYNDYRDGLEQYGDAAKIAEPILEWEGATPVGYNSWAALEFSVNYGLLTQMSDYIKDNLPSYGKDTSVYINVDSGFDWLSDAEKAAFVSHVNGNGQKAGAYWTPFSYWKSDKSDLNMPMTDIDDNVITDGNGKPYTYADAVLKDNNGEPIKYNGFCLDPTHPAVLKRIDAFLLKILDMGYEYLKLDFVVDGAVEGNHFDPSVTTGTTAYNYGMKYLHDYIENYTAAHGKDPFFLNIAISPVYSGRYVHSRRLSCDVFETIGSKQYYLNTLTYAWWMNGRIISVADPDHMVLYRHKSSTEAPASYNEALSTVNSVVISGSLLMWSDDIAHDESQIRAEALLNNTRLTYLASRKISFRPAASGQISEAYYCFDGDDLYIALFNFDFLRPRTVTLDLKAYGLSAKEYLVENINTGETFKAKNGKLYLTLPKEGSYIVRVDGAK